jgi:hypothetical protein
MIDEAHDDWGLETIRIRYSLRMRKGDVVEFRLKNGVNVGSDVLRFENSTIDQMSPEQRLQLLSALE